MAKTAQTAALEHKSAKPVSNAKTHRTAHSGRAHALQETLDPAKALDSVDLQTLGEDAQLANVDLQSVLQRQQQTLQAIARIAKSRHDLSMNLIRKMAG